MTQFRPCIDLHDGKVKQIVGGSLKDETGQAIENFVSDQPPEYFAGLYAADGLAGGHVIKLGPGNDGAARAALAAWPGGMQVGGGINQENAAQWLEAGASHVIVTSWLFDESGNFLSDRLQQLVSEIGKQHVVVDLSCRQTQSGWQVAMNRWQTLTNLPVDHATLDSLAESADEFLIHAADVEGLCEGIDQPLVKMLGEWGKIPMTYAGGVANFADVELVQQASQGAVNVTVGSSLDLFGGSGVRYADLVRWNQEQK